MSFKKTTDVSLEQVYPPEVDDKGAVGALYGSIAGQLLRCLSFVEDHQVQLREVSLKHHLSLLFNHVS